MPVWDSSGECRLESLPPAAAVELDRRSALISHGITRLLQAVHLGAMVSPIAKIVRKTAPTYYAKHLWSELRYSCNEQELYVAPLLCNRDKISIDIGAANGIYTFHIVDASRECLAFEPRQPAALRISHIAKCLSLPVRVEAVALSDEVGEATLRTSETVTVRATIESENLLDDCDCSQIYEVAVPRRKLDDYDFDAVGFIKIDVEGHELSVLRGASNTIERHRPLMLIEIEDRHKPNAICDVHNFLGNLGYEGYFLLNKKLMPLICFDLAAHQQNVRQSGLYINNFFFVMPENVHILESSVSRVRGNLSDDRLRFPG
jgi:FkbM family methyltransferase